MLRNLISAGLSKPLASQMLVASTLNVQQLRTTFVLKRKYPVPLAKKNQKPIKLRGRHFNYELIEDKNMKKHENIDIILTDYVEGVGRKGDIVSVKPNFAYNKLLLPGLATYVTQENIEKYKRADGDKSDEVKHSSQHAQRTVNVLQYRTFSIIMNKDHPWELQPWHIRASLRKAGVNILNDSSIQLPAEKITGPDLAKESKVFTVKVKVNNTETANVKCKIHHWSTDPTNRLPYVTEFYKMPSEPLFAEENSNFPAK